MRAIGARFKRLSLLEKRHSFPQATRTFARLASLSLLSRKNFIVCLRVLSKSIFVKIVFIGGRSDYSKGYEDAYNERSTIQQEFFNLLFEEWRKELFALEGIDGAVYRLNTPTIIGILLNATNVDFSTRHPQGCFVYVGKLPANERPLARFPSAKCFKF